MKRLMIAPALLLLTAGFALAQEQNDDWAYIKEWQAAQRAQAIAGVLLLDDTQIATLKDINGAVALVKEDYSILIDEQKATNSDLVAEIRARLEAGGDLTDEDKQSLKNARNARVRLREEARQAAKEEMVGIGEILTEKQIEAYKDFLLAERKQSFDARGKRAELAATNERNVRGDRKGSFNRIFQRALAFLASDTFLANAEN